MSDISKVLLGLTFNRALDDVALIVSHVTGALSFGRKVRLFFSRSPAGLILEKQVLRPRLALQVSGHR